MITGVLKDFVSGVGAVKCPLGWAGRVSQILVGCKFEWKSVYETRTQTDIGYDHNSAHPILRNFADAFPKGAKSFVRCQQLSAFRRSGVHIGTLTQARVPERSAVAAGVFRTIVSSHFTAVFLNQKRCPNMDGHWLDSVYAAK